MKDCNTECTQKRYVYGLAGNVGLRPTKETCLACVASQCLQLERENYELTRCLAIGRENNARKISPEMFQDIKARLKTYLIKFEEYETKKERANIRETINSFNLTVAYN